MGDSEDTEPVQHLAEELAVATNRNSEPEDEPFKPLIDDLGLEERAESQEQLLIYRETPDRECFVCGESIPDHGHALDGGEQYLVQRTNREDSPYPLTERTFHAECWDEHNG
jgi:hypothetical protein